MARWTVIRKVMEEYEIEADTKEEAKNKIENPHSVTVLEETITKARDTVTIFGFPVVEMIEDEAKFIDCRKIKFGQPLL